MSNAPKLETEAETNLSNAARLRDSLLVVYEMFQEPNLDEDDICLRVAKCLTDVPELDEKILTFVQCMSAIKGLGRSD